MKQYKFSPIKTKEVLLDAVSYIAQETTKLCSRIIGETYPIHSLTVFSHYPDEYEKLKQILLNLGKLKAENNGPFVELKQPITLPHNKLSFLRVRKPDPYRMQVGCTDFEVPSYEEFKKKFLSKKENLRLIERPEYEMIEFFDADFDVLAYIVSKELIQ